MGKYSNILYSNLREIANQALNELKSYGLNEFKNSLNSNGVLPGGIKKNVNGFIKQINDDKSINGTIGLLEFNLNKLVKVMNKVEAYQNKEEEYNDFKSCMDDEDSGDRRKLKRLKKELQNCETAVTNELNKTRSSFF